MLKFPSQLDLHTYMYCSSNKSSNIHELFSLFVKFTCFSLNTYVGVAEFQKSYHKGLSVDVMPLQ